MGCVFDVFATRTVWSVDLGNERFEGLRRRNGFSQISFCIALIEKLLKGPFLFECNGKHPLLSDYRDHFSIVARKEDESSLFVALKFMTCQSVVGHVVVLASVPQTDELFT